MADNSVLMDMVPLAEVSSFSCPLCGKQFDRELKRDHHVVRKHTKAYPLQCTMCRRGFMFRKNLDKHFQDTHSCEHFFSLSLSCPVLKLTTSEIPLNRQKFFQVVLTVKNPAELKN